MKRQGKCIHFNGVSNACCEAGVDYKKLAGWPEVGWTNRLPCHTADYKSGSGYSLPTVEAEQAKCEKFALPTAEEIAADEKKIAEHFERMAKARAAIVAHLGGPWKKGMPSRAGSIDCPCCGIAPAKLNFTRSGYNGHIHAACESQDCVSWME